MAYRYYLTQRPPMPGAFPNPSDNKALDLWDFGERIFCEQVNRNAWGYVDYAKPLTAEQVQSYEMVGGKQPKEYTVKVTTITTLTVEAESEDEAKDKACEMAWKYDADELNGEIVGGAG